MTWIIIRNIIINYQAESSQYENKGNRKAFPNCDNSDFRKNSKKIKK